MAASIYARERQDSDWRYRRVKKGRGYQTSGLIGPFYARAARNGNRAWHKLEDDGYSPGTVDDHLSISLAKITCRWPISANLWKNLDLSRKRNCRRNCNSTRMNPTNRSAQRDQFEQGAGNRHSV